MKSKIFGELTAIAAGFFVLFAATACGDDAHDPNLTVEEDQPQEEEQSLSSDEGKVSGVRLLSSDHGKSWFVDYVLPGSPAEKAGVQVDDQILSIGGMPLPSEAADVPSGAACDSSKSNLRGQWEAIRNAHRLTKRNDVVLKLKRAGEVVELSTELEDLSVLKASPDYKRLACYLLCPTTCLLVSVGYAPCPYCWYSCGVG